MLGIKPGDIKYLFLSLWYDSTWDGTQVSRTIGEHSTHSDEKKFGWKKLSFPSVAQSQMLKFLSGIWNWPTIFIFLLMFWTESGKIDAIEM